MTTTPEALARQTEPWRCFKAKLTHSDAAMGMHVERRPVLHCPPRLRQRGVDMLDYLLFVDQEPVGAVEAKKEGTSLTGAEVQTVRRFLQRGQSIPTAAHVVGAEHRRTLAIVQLRRTASARQS